MTIQARTGTAWRLVLQVRWHLLLAGTVALLALAVRPWDDTVVTALRQDSLRHLPVVADLQEFFKVFGKGHVLLLIALLMGTWDFRRQAVRVLLALLVVGIMVEPLKIGVGRPRPRGGRADSFPSGDTAGAVVTAIAVVEEVPVLLPVAAVVGCAVGAGRVSVLAHYPTDVLAGVVCGALAAGIASLLARRIPAHRLPARRHFVWGLGITFGCFAVGAITHKSGTDIWRFLKVFGPSLILLLGYRVAGSVPWARFAGWLQRREWRVLCLLLPLLVGYLLMAGRSTLWDRDEPRFSEATVEMVQSGNWLVPTFNGALRPDKPVLIYWLMAVPVMLLGKSALSCRLMAILATGIASWLTYRLGRRLFGPEAGLWSAAMLGTTLLLSVSGTGATTDAVLLCFIFASILLIGTLSDNPERSWGRTLGLGLCLAGAALTKGPVGLAVPALALLGMRFLRRRQGISGPFPWGKVGLAFALACGLFLLWAIPANRATGGEFMRRGIGHHVLARMARPLESHGGKFVSHLPYYLGVIMLGFFPWMLFLPRAFAGLRNPADDTRRARWFLVGWIVPTLILMTLVATKLPHYILPVWPALAALCGPVVVQSPGELSRGYRWWQGLHFGVFLVLGSAIAVACFFLPWFLQVRVVHASFASASLVAGTMTVLAARQFHRRQYRTCAGVLFGGMLLLLFTLGLYVLPELEKLKLGPAVAEVINQSYPEAKVSAYGFEEPSLNFYLDARHVSFLDKPDQVTQWASARDPQSVLVVTTRHLEKMGTDPLALGTQEVARIHGYNYSKGRWLDVLVLVPAAVSRE